MWCEPGGACAAARIRPCLGMGMALQQAQGRLQLPLLLRCYCGCYGRLYPAALQLQADAGQEEPASGIAVPACVMSETRGTDIRKLQQQLAVGVQSSRWSGTGCAVNCCVGRNIHTRAAPGLVAPCVDPRRGQGA